MANGKKRSLLEYKKEIDDGKDVLAIAESDDKFGTFLQYRSGLHEYAQYKRGKTIQSDREPPKVYIRIGAPGTGKSRWLDEQFGLTGWVEAPDNTGNSVNCDNLPSRTPIENVKIEICTKFQEEKFTKICGLNFHYTCVNVYSESSIHICIVKVQSTYFGKLFCMAL